jgi:predicted PurR-regulated permease PerM
MKISLLNKQNFGRIFFVTLAFIGTIAIFYKFLTIIALAAVFAFALDPYIRRVRDSGITSRSLGAGLIVSIVLLTVTGPILLAFYQTYMKVTDLQIIGNSMDVKAKAMLLLDKFTVQLTEVLRDLGFHVDISIFSQNQLERLTDFAINFGTSIVTKMPEFLFMLFVLTITTFFFLSQSRRIHTFFEKTKFLSRKEVFHLVNSIRISSRSAVISSVATGLFQATVVATAVSLAGYHIFSLIFIVTFFLSFIPIGGAVPVVIFMLIPAFVDGNRTGIIILIASTIITGVVDNIIRMMIIGRTENDIHPILALLSIFGGITMFGLPGLFLGPVIVDTAYRIIPTLAANINFEEEVVIEPSNDDNDDLLEGEVLTERIADLS